MECLHVGKANQDELITQRDRQKFPSDSLLESIGEANRSYPAMLRIDNGPEFISLALADWAEKHAVKLEFIQLDKPTQSPLTGHIVQKYPLFICSER